MKKYYISILLLFVSFSALYAQWQTVTVTGLTGGFGISQMYDDGTTLWAGATGQIFKSTDQGSSWTEVSTGLQSGISNCTGIVKQGDRVYASFSGNGNHNVYYTTNAGQSWVIDTAGWSSVAGVLPAAVQLTTHKDYVLARLESNFVLYKKNTDAQWSILNVPPAFKTPATVYSVGDTLVLGVGYMALSTDMGANWITRQGTLPSGLPPGFLSAVYQDKANPSTLFGNYYMSADRTGKLMLSKDNQLTWDSLHIQLDDPQPVSSMWIKGNDVYVAFLGTFTAGDTLRKFFHSSDGGQHWTNMTDNLYTLSQFKFHSIRAMAVAGGNIYVGGFQSPQMLKHTAGSTGIREVKQNAHLHVYPNPAAGSITVEGHASCITITDLQGKALISVADHNGSAIDVSSLPQGMYLLKAQQGEQQLVTKFVKE